MSISLPSLQVEHSEMLSKPEPYRLMRAGWIPGVLGHLVLILISVVNMPVNVVI